MPSFSGTAATVLWTGGAATFEPARFSGTAAVVRWVGGSSGFSITQPATVPRIERLRRFEERGAARVQMSAREQIVQQRNAEGIENAFAQINANIAAVEATLNIALAALTKATAVDDKITVEGSYTSPVSVGSASSSGTITIAAHTRYYAGVEADSVSVNAGSVTGLSSGDYATVFYRDAARAGGAVTYEATTSAIAQTGNIHIVWMGEIPSAGDPPSTGNSPSAPGYIPPTNSNPDYLEP